MNNECSLASRPPIGFIVEGDCEYASYPSLVSKITQVRGLYTPIVNAGSCGSVIRNIADHLTHICRTHNPLEIIITFDLRDALRGALAENCACLIAYLGDCINTWLSTSANDPRLNPLPNLITIVAQIQQFDTWLIADIQGMVSLKILPNNHPQINNIDDQIQNPVRWLESESIGYWNLKSPRHAKSIVSRMDVGLMRTNSRSFDKFFREVWGSYSRWMEAICNEQ